MHTSSNQGKEETNTKAQNLLHLNTWKPLSRPWNHSVSWERKQKEEAESAGAILRS